jgi:elongation factor P--(R)-beta-lysine ligase
MTLHDFHPTANWENLRFRVALLHRLRDFFDSRGFLEVETPILSADTVVDRHLDPFCVAEGSGFGVQGSESKNLKSQISKSPNLLWLQTSPEFAMKRMLAAGAGRIYQVARVFRLDELGPLHNPEFTLVEWYQPGEGLDEGMQLTSDLCEVLLTAGRRLSGSPSPGQRPEEAGAANSPFIGPTGQPFPEPLARWADETRSTDTSSPGRCPGLGEQRSFGAETVAERVSYAEAFNRYVGVDPHTADGEQLAAAAKRLRVESPASLPLEDRDGWLDLLMVERIQPHLGKERPTLLYDYPASQAALARIRHEEGKPPVAERFELYIGGVEIANGYHELLDPAELRARNASVNAQRVADGKAALPEESRLLAAMQSGLPASVGVALGFDRLVMATIGAKTIAEVIAFPFDRA